MISKVLDTIKDNHMFELGDRVIVAVSGGADSMCLLHILHSFREELGINLIVAHINHCLRGDEADADEEYVQKFCIENEIEFYSKRVDINKMAKEKNLSSETAGREARYNFFNQLREEFGAKKIAIAHNANDQAETVLMRIMRGTGIEGLIGIRPVRDGIYVRPLINTTREEIERYCNKNHIDFRTDKTNLENIYRRNKIRLELIPYIKENFNPDIIETINRLADNVKTDNEFLENITTKKYEKYCDIRNDRVIISKEAFFEPEALVTRIIRMSLIRFTGNVYNFEKIHIYDVIQLQKQGTGKVSMLPNGVTVHNVYGDIHIMYRYDNSNENKEDREYELDIGSNNIKELGFEIKLKTFPRDKDINLNTNKYTKYFDCDKIEKKVLVRYRRNGDRFTGLGMKGSKKLKDFFIDMKVPKEERDKTPLVCSNNDIIWVVGHRVSEKFKVDNNTKNILEIRFEREG